MHHLNRYRSTEEAKALLRAADDIIVKEVAPKTAVVRDNLHDAHALITRDEMRVDAPMLEHAPNLKVVARMSVGFHNVDVEAATKRGILIMNTPGVSAIAAGEHTLTLMLAVSRRIPTVHNSLREGYWLLDRSRQVGTQLYDKTIGLIGLGRVGAIVAQRCLAFGMTILAYDPYISEDSVDDRIQLVGFKELLQHSDFVSLHVPLTRETEGMLNAESIAQMKIGARFINTAHGLIVDEHALAEALKSGHLAGAGIDAFSEEPPYNSPLIGLDNVVHTPHVGDNTVEATQDISLRVVRQVLDALHDKDYRNVINLPMLPGVDYETIRPYMRLAERMGLLLHSLSRTPIRRVALEVRGNDMSGLIKPLTVGVLKGLLQPILGAKVNSVNAPLLANERGWQITQAKGLRAAAYSNVINLQVTLDDGEIITMTGALLDKSEPYVIQINQYRMNFVPHGHLLLMGSYDKPGVIGRVGTLLSENNVNIAGWYTGRAGPGGNTLSVLTLDEALPENVIYELEQLDFIRHAHQLWINSD
ncbi:MAG: phosphoglycerate dehydrogenase [Anaerolineae bacterium]|nr:phosphoglycerate dehydrogenase [Anaerolineae bacterium]